MRAREMFATLAVACALMTIAACGGQAKVNANNVETKIKQAPDTNVVTVAHPEQFSLVAVELRKVTNQLSANGVVAPDVSRNVPVNTMTGGRVVSGEGTSWATLNTSPPSCSTPRTLYARTASPGKRAYLQSA